MYAFVDGDALDYLMQVVVIKLDALFSASQLAKMLAHVGGSVNKIRQNVCSASHLNVVVAQLQKSYSGFFLSLYWLGEFYEKEWVQSKKSRRWA